MANKKNEIVIRIPTSKTRMTLSEEAKLADTVDWRLRHYVGAGITQYFVESLDGMLEGEHKAVVDASRSAYTLTMGEFKRGIARAVLFGCKIARHDRGKLPNSYKYRPTSQCIGITVERLKSMYRITVKQLSST